MNVEKAIGNFLFRSKFSEWLWTTSTGSSFYVVRLLGAVLISIFLVARAGRLFVYTKLTSSPVLGFLFTGTIIGGPLKTLAAGMTVGIGYLLYAQIRQPAVNSGHRAGGKGFTGSKPENSLEALRDLIKRDNAGLLKDFHYLEFDVHETKDGELVILHDLSSLLEASRNSDVNSAAIAEFRAINSDLGKLNVEDLTTKQLRGIHIGGNRGVFVPPLSEFLRVCETEGIRRSLGVEVKSIKTDEGRQKFLDLLSAYKAGYCSKLEQMCPQNKYKPFEWVAAIAFPFFWAPSFGEFCSSQWDYWAKKFRAAGIPVRSCVLHSLDLVPPTR